LDEFHEHFEDIESKYGRLVGQDGELVEIIVLEQRVEQFQTLIMTKICKKQTDASVSKEGLMICLLCLMLRS
jgi:hypothetical protein